MEREFNEFAFEMFRILSENNNDNTLLSPFSILTSLNVCLLGAKNNTEKELFEGLKYNYSFAESSEVHEFMKKIIDIWTENSDQFSLNLINSLLINKESDCTVDGDFREKLSEMYKAEAEEVDFENENESLIESCNKWVSDKTNGLISSIIDELSPSSKAVLLNAIYFKGNWKTEFHASLTADQPFFNYGDKDREAIVPLMFKEELGCKVYSVNIESEELRMLELPYKGNLSMNIMLTKSIDGLHKILPKISLSVLEDMEILSHKADVWLPKFKMEAKYDLVDALKKLGIHDSFTEAADFSGIRNKENVCTYVSNVTHKAVIEVDEKGTETAEATAIEMILSCSLPLPITQFRVDHPFAFYIKDNSNGIILFVGKILSL